MTAALSGPAKISHGAGARLLADVEDLLSYYRERGLTHEPLQIAEAQFIAALVRYRLAPPTEKLVAERVHVMVFGGAGAGKSTVANILVGAQVADVNAQAGYTRHPTAFFRSDVDRPEDLWPRSLGRLERCDFPSAANVDQDLYGWQRIEGELVDPGFLRRHVVWDCPDLTTKDAEHYQSRVVEIAGLAEIGVYVASDERYNDELPTNFLQAMLDAGKWVVVALTKVSISDAEELERLFKDQVVSRLRRADRILAIVVVPSPPSGEMEDLWSDSSPYGVKMREAVEQATADFARCKRDAAIAACKYLAERQSKLLEPLRKDLGEWRAWAEMIRQHANESVLRYDRDYLSRTEHRQFKEALTRLEGLMSLPGRLDYVWKTQEFLRTPYRLAKSFGRRFTSLESGFDDEDQALDETRRELYESLLVAAATHHSRHPFWKELHTALESDAPPVVEPIYRRAREQQRRALDQRLSTITRNIPESIERSALLIGSLRAIRLLIDVGGLGLAVYLTYHYLGGLSLLTILFALLFLGLLDDGVGWLLRQYVHRHREGVAHQQKEHVRELIRTAYIEPLLSMPPGKGRRLYGLAELADRLPRDLAEASAAVEGRA